MLHKAGFWEKEHNAPLFIMEDGFLERSGDSAFTRALGWCDSASSLVSTSPNSTSSPPAASTEAFDDSKIPRIVIKDAERTFVDEGNRLQLARFLTKLQTRFGDYSQGLGFVASFSLLFLEEAKAEQLLVSTNYDTNFIPGYWKNEAIGFATDAYVFAHLLSMRNPKLAQHLQSLYVLPEMYCQKWFTNLCVHVLPFENVFQIFDNFFTVGFKFLFQFALSLMDRLEEQLISTKDVGHLLGILRLDTAHLSNNQAIDYSSVIEKAKTIDVTTGIDYPKLRAELYEKHLRARIERARKLKEEEEKEAEEEDEDDDEEDDD